MITERAVYRLLIEAQLNFIAHIKRAKKIPEAQIVYARELITSQIEVRTLMQVLELPEPDWQKVADNESFASVGDG